MDSHLAKPRRRKSASAKNDASQHDNGKSHPDVLAVHPISAAAAIETGMLYGERQADFVIALLNALLSTAKQRGDTIQVADIPPAVLLEFAALIQLRVWEQAGIAPESLGLPSSRDATMELCDRIQRDRSRFQKLEAAGLDSRVAAAWFHRFAWNAPGQLDADVVGGDLEVEDAVEALAQLLWRYRNHSRLQPE